MYKYNRTRLLERSAIALLSIPRRTLLIRRMSQLFFCLSTST
nr:MAG TPA: hypothetical protein [Caudoviricetes sp.]